MTETFEMKQVQFYVTLLSVFLNSALSTSTETILKISEAEKQSIVQSVDFNDIQNYILGLVAKIISKGNFLSEDKLIVENCLALWSGCVIFKPELFE